MNRGRKERYREVRGKKRKKRRGKKGRKGKREGVGKRGYFAPFG